MARRYAGARGGDAVIVVAVRTPFGRLGGGLAGYPATELGRVAIARRSNERARARRGRVRDHGPGAPGRRGQAPARQAAIGAGIPKEVPADTINKVCASSIRAIEIADLMIRAGGHELVVTGGMESMSNAPYLLPKARFGYRLGNGEVVDHMVFDGLTSTFDGLHMVAAGVAGVPRARDLARGPGRVGVSLAPARGGRPGRGPLRRRDRPGRRRRGRRGHPARHDAREARRRCSPSSTRRARPRPETRRA